MPQGSVLGPVLFTLYTGPIGQIVRRHRLDFPLFADDSQLYVSFKIKDTNDEMAALAACPVTGQVHHKGGHFQGSEPGVQWHVVSSNLESDVGEIMLPCTVSTLDISC